MRCRDITYDMKFDVKISDINEMSCDIICNMLTFIFLTFHVFSIQTLHFWLQS